MILHSIILAVSLAPQVQDTTRPTPLAPIVVTATRSPLDPMQSPLPATTLGGNRLHRETGVSLAGMVAATPGVRALTTGEQIGKPVIRGLSGARVLVLEGGHRLEDYSWSDEDGPSVDPRLTDRIEVIRGPASLLYGSDAIGGVVNAIPEDVPAAADGTRLLRWRLDLFGSSNNPGGGAALGGEWARGAWGARARFVGRFAGNMQTPAGELDNTGFGALNGEVAVGVRGERSRATLRFARFGGEYKLLEANPPTPPPAGVAEAGPERKVDDNRVQLDAETWWRGLRLEARGQVQRHGIIELSDEGAVTPGTEVETFNLGLVTSTLDLLAHHRLGRGEGTVGVSGLHSSNDTRGLVPLVPDARTSGVALFVVERVPMGRFSLMAGLRGDLRRLSAHRNGTLQLGAQTRNYRAVTGDVGVAWALARGVAFAVNAGRAYRAPNLFELFSNGPRLGEARYEIGDPAMTPEVSFNVDASLRWQAARVRGEIAVYRNRVDHFIYVTPTTQFQQTGTPAAPDSLRVYLYGQAARATLWGGEASVAMDVSARLTLGARFDAVHGTNDAQRGPLPLMPPPRGVLEAELHGAPGSRRWHVGTDVELVARQTRLAQFTVPGSGVVAADIPTAGYVLLGFDGGFDTEAGGRPVTIGARLRNAANVSYRNYLNRYKEFALDAGRSFTVTVGTSF